MTRSANMCLEAQQQTTNTPRRPPVEGCSRCAMNFCMESEEIAQARRVAEQAFSWWEASNWDCGQCEDAWLDALTEYDRLLEAQGLTYLDTLDQLVPLAEVQG